MIRASYGCSTPPFAPGPCSRNYHASHRSKLEHHLLRPRGRWRPHPLPTSVLILRAPRSLHSYFTRVRNDFTYRRLLLRQERALRLHGHGLSYNGNRSSRIHCVSPSHVHCWDGRRHSSLLHFRYNNYRDPHRSKSIQLTSNPSWGKHQVRNPHTVGPWLYLPLHRRGPHGNRFIKFVPRHCSSRHVLRSRTLPLRPLNRSCLRYYGCICPLIPSILRLHPRWYVNKNPLRSHVCRG